MDLDGEIKAQIQAALDAGDIDQIREILTTLDSVECPEMVKVEFTRTQFKELEFLRQNLKQPNIPTILRLMVDGFMPNYKKAQRAAHKISVPG
jgi:hypothetical protein